MPLGESNQTGGGFFDFKDLVTRSGGTVFVFCRPHEFKEAESGTKRSERGPVLPVVTDVFVATGPDAGRLLPMEEIIGAPTAALRGVKNPSAKNNWTISEPTNAIDVAGNLAYPFIVSIGNNAGNDFVQFDKPKGAHADRANELYEKFGGDAMWSGKVPAGAVPPAAKPEPAMAAAAAGGDDDLPW